MEEDLVYLRLGWDQFAAMKFYNERGERVTFRAGPPDDEGFSVLIATTEPGVALHPLVTRRGPAFSRQMLVAVLIEHQRHDPARCLCGWDQIGRSHAEHVADIYEAAMGKED
jgi:hypothetical protein